MKKLLTKLLMLFGYRSKQANTKSEGIRLIVPEGTTCAPCEVTYCEAGRILAEGAEISNKLEMGEGWYIEYPKRGTVQDKDGTRPLTKE